jgi:two-component system, LuxR family, response regulator FixJ
MLDIIDDDEAVRESTKALLESHGYDVRSHPSAEHFLEAGGPKADCLLVDYHMPGMTGLDLIEHLRAQGDNTPAVILTARGDAALSARLARIGIAVLHKPVAESVLVGWIAQAQSA